MTNNAGDSDNIEKVKKTDGKKRTVGIAQIMFTEQILTRAIFLLTPAATMLGTSRFFSWLHEMAACSYFGADLGN